MDEVKREEEEEEKRGRDDRVKFQIRRIELQNIFVTQLEEGRDEDPNIRRFPVVKEGPDRLLEAPGAAPQETLLLRREAERRGVDAELEEARRRFRRSAEERAARGIELRERRERAEERARRLRPVLREQDERTRRALLRERRERAEAEEARREAERLRGLLSQLQRRCQKLQRTTSRCKVYDEFLTKALDHFREGDAGSGGHDVSGLIQRHEGLEAASAALLGRLGDLGHDLEQAQLQLAQLTRSFSHTSMVTHGEVSELRCRRERAQERCRGAEERLLALRQQHSAQGQEIGSMLMAIDNLAESCNLRQYGSLQDMNSFSKLDMIQEYLLEKTEVARAARASARLPAPSASGDRSRKAGPRGPRAPRASARTGSVPRLPLPAVPGQGGPSGRQESTQALVKMSVPAVK